MGNNPEHRSLGCSVERKPQGDRFHAGDFGQVGGVLKRRSLPVVQHLLGQGVGHLVIEGRDDLFRGGIDVNLARRFGINRDKRPELLDEGAIESLDQGKFLDGVEPDILSPIGRLQGGIVR